MAVVYSKVLLFDPPLIYTAPDTCVFGAVFLERYDEYRVLLIGQMSSKNHNAFFNLLQGTLKAVFKTCASIELIGKYESYDIVILSACNINH